MEKINQNFVKKIVGGVNMDEKIIEMRKKFSKLINTSKQQAKKNECLWCGRKITRFCNSHSLPQCILRNIDTDGRIDYFNSMVNIPFLNSDKGIKEAGTFKLLCRECDGKIFQDYESLEALCDRPSEVMLEEIALKNVLMMLNKRYMEIQLYNNMQNEFSMPYLYEKKQEVNSLDERDFWWDFVRIREMIYLSDQKKSKFKTFYWRKLDYIIPVAFQGLVTLYGDLDGNMVTDIYNTSEDLIVKHLHICMFPLETSSVVFAFYHEDDEEYDNFASQFNELEDDEKLTMLSYIVFEYSEDMLLAKKFPHRTWIINKLKETFMDSTEIWALDKEHAEYIKKSKLNNLKNRDKNFPCILFEKYAVKK